MLQKLRSTQPYALNAALLVLRITFGFLMMRFGWNKLMQFEEKAASWPDPLHVGHAFSMSLTIFAELICAGFVVIGLYTRFFLIPLIFLMMVAIFVIHAGDPLDVREHAISFLIPFIFLMMAGPGRYSADGLMRK